MQNVPYRLSFAFLKPPKKYTEQLTAIDDSIRELGQDLGLDLTRHLQNGRTHIYPRRIYRIINKGLGRHERGTAIKLRSGDVHVSEYATLVGTLSHACHEIIHRAEGPGETTAVGEIITEMTNIDLMRNYWGRHPALPANAADTYTDIGYPAGVLLMDEMVSRAADPRATFKVMQRSNFTDGTERDDALAALVGEEGMQLLTTVDINSSRAVRTAAEQVGYMGTVNRIDEAREARGRLDPSTLMQWL